MSTSDLGFLIAAVWLAGIAALISIVGAWGPKPKTTRPESLSERNHRIDAEALAACEPPVIWSGGNTLPDYDANVAARWKS